MELTEILDALLDALIDTAKLLPILFLTYLAMEAIEHYAGERTYAWIKKARGAGPLIGALIGLIPQCGFAGGAASLYAGGALTAGTLAAVFVATSDEMLPILISEGGDGLWGILAFKLAAAALSGFAIDALLRAIRRKKGVAPGDGEINISAFCEHDGCDCDGEHHGILLPALRHTVRIGLIILAASACLGVIFCFIGEEELARLPINVPVLGEALAALFGLIPNCSVSVLLTKLYTGGVMGVGPMLAGLISNGGVGLLVLYRANGSMKKNVAFTALMWALGLIWGVAARYLLALI